MDIKGQLINKEISLLRKDFLSEVSLQIDENFDRSSYLHGLSKIQFEQQNIRSQRKSINLNILGSFGLHSSSYNSLENLEYQNGSSPKFQNQSPKFDVQSPKFDRSSSPRFDRGQSLVFRNDDLEQLEFRVQNLTLNSMDGKTYTLKLLIIIDHRQQRDLEQIEMAHKFKSILLNSFSHELRTPLNCSQQLLDSMKLEIKDPYIVEQYIKPLNSSNYLLLHQINDILDFNSFQSGDFVHNNANFDLWELMQELRQIFLPCCRQKNIEIRLKRKTDKNLKSIKNDQRRIQQILINLINNSIKFTNQGGEIIIKISDSKDQEQKNFIVLSVLDNGIGIEKEKLAMIRNHIYNQDKNDQKFEFIGLGLVLSQKLAMGLGQFSQFTNNLQIHQRFSQTGTKLQFTIQDYNLRTYYDTYEQFESPIDVNQENLIQSIQSSNIQVSILKSFQSCCNQINILIVDDVPFNVLALKTLLKRKNLQTDVCYNGQEAVNMVKYKYEKKCDCNGDRCRFYRLILMDIQMPIMDGLKATLIVNINYKFINQFLEANNLKDQTKIVICSAFDSQEYIDETMNLGVMGFIVKPIPMLALNKTLEKVGL